MRIANKEYPGQRKIKKYLISTLVAVSLINSVPTFAQTPHSENIRLEKQRVEAEDECRSRRDLDLMGCGTRFSAYSDSTTCQSFAQSSFDTCMKRARSDYKWGLQNAQAKAKESFNDSLQLVAMIEGEIGGEPMFGAGIIFGLARNRAYVVTANHLVRRGNQEATNLKVLLRPINQQPMKASLNEHFDTNIDLAVVTVEGLEEAGVDCQQLRFNQLGDLAALSRNDDVFPVGNPNGVAWGYPVAPDKVSEVLSGNITFQSSFITVGHSGGALIDEAGLLVGMILKDAPPFGVARSLSNVISIIRNWHIPVDLEQPAEGSPDKTGNCQ
jgi:S1-C subfamily serine protease